MRERTIGHAVATVAATVAAAASATSVKRVLLSIADPIVSLSQTSKRLVVDLKRAQ